MDSYSCTPCDSVSLDCIFQRRQADANGDALSRLKEWKEHIITR